MRFLILFLLFLTSKSAFSELTKNDDGPTFQVKNLMQGGWDFSSEIPLFSLNSSANIDYSPNIHIRYFFLENFSMGLYGLNTNINDSNSSFVGLSLKGYFLAYENLQFYFNQTFTISADGRAKIVESDRDDGIFSEARLGLQYAINKKFWIGASLNNQENLASNYSVNLNINYYTHIKPSKYNQAESKKIIDDSNKSIQKRFGSKSAGHILSSNATNLQKGEFTFGTLYTGYGITDEWTIATSTFAYLLYNLGSVVSRSSWEISDTEKIGLEFNYFKSLRNIKEETSPESGFESFKMEAGVIKLTYSKLVNPTYRASITASYFHYFDDERPFSLRMDPQNSDEYSANLTSFHEFKVSDNFFIQGELGAWGINYNYPYAHAGLSAVLQRKNILFSFGASTTYSPNFPEERERRFASYSSKQSIHPELQVQLIF